MRCAKFFASVSLVMVVVVLVCSPALARSIPGAPNEVDDPWFENPNGPGNWFTNPDLVPWIPPPQQSEYPTIVPNDPSGDLPGGYLDPGRHPGDKVFIRTIVDDFEGLWDPNLSNKEIDLSFFAHVAGDGYVDVWFDWWNDPNIPEPSNDPNDPTGGSPPPDGIVGPYRITALGMHSGFTIIPPEDTPESEGSMKLYSFHDIWDHQPRWVSIEIESGIFLGEQQGGEALITGIDFEAQCVPEPSTVIMLCMGAFGLLAFARRRR